MAQVPDAPVAALLAAVRADPATATADWSVYARDQTDFGGRHRRLVLTLTGPWLPVTPGDGGDAR